MLIIHVTGANDHEMWERGARSVAKTNRPTASMDARKTMHSGNKASVSSSETLARAFRILSCRVEIKTKRKD